MADNRYGTAAHVNSYRLTHDINLDTFQSEDLLDVENDFGELPSTDEEDVGYNNDHFRMTPEHKRHKPRQGANDSHLQAEMIKLDIMEEAESGESDPKPTLNIFEEESDITEDTTFYIGTDENTAESSPVLSRRSGRQLPKVPVAAEGNLQAELAQAEKKQTELQTDKQTEYGYSPCTQSPPEITVIPTESPGFVFDSVSREHKPMLSAGNLLLLEDSSRKAKSNNKPKLKNIFNKQDETDGSQNSEKKKSGFSPATLCINGEVKQQTHLAMFRFLKRHDDEIELDIGDPVYVEAMCEDLWYEGVNLRNGAEGCFPSVYVREISEDTESEPGMGGRAWCIDKFLLKFLGSIEVPSHKGNDVLCKAMQKIVTARRMTIASSPPTLSLLEISVRGIKMTDQSKPKMTQRKDSVRKKMGKLLGNKDKKASHNHFFSLKNVSFCGYHPKNDRYFGFITKHPSERRFACHVFVAEEGKSTKPVAEAFGRAFRSFYDQFLEYTHPTEDIYME
ncbi:C-Jun-amino-terminal kinase-interacting protein 1-like isoform X2 [Ptychodera flava]|uniref:C-Jun-amino-terminal kinase-interacting protein 1-like isoform X2 n=1 Tax=Ptychodera flava TaxID=63121 RepID=UPI003969D163